MKSERPLTDEETLRVEKEVDKTGESFYDARQRLYGEVVRGGNRLVRARRQAAAEGQTHYSRRGGWSFPEDNGENWEHDDGVERPPVSPEEQVAINQRGNQLVSDGVARLRSREERLTAATAPMTAYDRQILLPTKQERNERVDESWKALEDGRPFHYQPTLVEQKFD